MRGCACRGTAGFAHVSCLAEQAKVLVEEAEENNLGENALTKRWYRWSECSLCEQRYHGLVKCALGWACWKTYVGRPDGDLDRIDAMKLLGNGLDDAGHNQDALSVRETELSMARRIGAEEEDLLATQSNLAITYGELGHHEKALSMEQDVYSGSLKSLGEEDPLTLQAANNYASSLGKLKRFEEAKSLMRKTMPVARRVLGGKDGLTLKMRWTYARALYMDDGATLDDLREAVRILEETARISERVMGGAHPTTADIGSSLGDARAALAARDTPPTSN